MHPATHQRRYDQLGDADGNRVERIFNGLEHLVVQDIFPTETAFLHMRVLQQREIRHLMTREQRESVLILEDRPFLDGPEVFVKRMIEAREMPAAHARLYATLFHQTLHHERIRLPDLTVYLRTEPALLETRRLRRAATGDRYAQTITAQYLREIHECYESLAASWRGTSRWFHRRRIRHSITARSRWC